MAQLLECREPWLFFKAVACYLDVRYDVCDVSTTANECDYSRVQIMILVGVVYDFPCWMR